MFVLLNGSFGIGKSTVARELRALLPGSTIANPEPFGVALQRLARRHRSDFQHDPIWRRFVVAWAGARGRWARTVILPMAISDLPYLDEIRAGLARSGRPVRHFCLTAPLAVVRERLARRGEPPNEPRHAWVHRRAAECCVAHAGLAFGEHVPADARPASAVARDLAARLRRPPFAIDDVT